MQTSPPEHPADAALAGAVAGEEDDRAAILTLADVATAAEADEGLVAAIVRSGLLVPHHMDPNGVPRFTPADVEAVRNGLRLLAAGLPLGELLALAARADAALSGLADAAVEAFLRFVRDPVVGAVDDERAAARLVEAYATMLPATTAVIAHHFRRRLLTRAAERLAMAEQHPSG